MRLHVRCYLWREGLLLDAGQFGRPQACISALCMSTSQESALAMHIIHICTDV